MDLGRYVIPDNCIFGWHLGRLFLGVVPEKHPLAELVAITRTAAINAVLEHRGWRPYQAFADSSSQYRHRLVVFFDMALGK